LTNLSRGFFPSGFDLAKQQTNSADWQIKLKQFKTPGFYI